MVNVEYVNKLRDKNNKIVGYNISDPNNNTMDISAKDLKQAILDKKVYASNLQLTSDGRLADKADTSLKSESKKAEFVAQIQEIKKKFYASVGGRDPRTGGVSSFDSSMLYTDDIYYVYFPETYKGNFAHKNKCYGVTITASCSNNFRRVRLRWACNNGMGPEEFSEVGILSRPAYSDDNIQVIRETFNRFIEKVIKWINEDKQGLDHPWCHKLPDQIHL